MILPTECKLRSVGCYRLRIRGASRSRNGSHPISWTPEGKDAQDADAGGDPLPAVAWPYLFCSHKFLQILAACKPLISKAGNFFESNYYEGGT